MLSPFELHYDHLLVPNTVQSEPLNISPTLLNPLLTFLRSLLWSHARDQLPQPSDTTKITPSLQMGDLVYLKSTATPGHLQEKWRGLFMVILTIPMAAKLAGFPSQYMFKI
jgi:hypothetical protein